MQKIIQKGWGSIKVREKKKKIAKHDNMNECKKYRGRKSKMELFYNLTLPFDRITFSTIA